MLHPHGLLRGWLVSTSGWLKPYHSTFFGDRQAVTSFGSNGRVINPSWVICQLKSKLSSPLSWTWTHCQCRWQERYLESGSFIFHRSTSDSVYFQGCEIWLNRFSTEPRWRGYTLPSVKPSLELECACCCSMVCAFIDVMCKFNGYRFLTSLFLKRDKLETWIWDLWVWECSRIFQRICTSAKKLIVFCVVV